MNASGGEKTFPRGETALAKSRCSIRERQGEGMSLGGGHRLPIGTQDFERSGKVYAAVRRRFAATQ